MLSSLTQPDRSCALRAIQPLAAAAALLGCADGPSAQATTPSLTWQGATRIGVQCVVSSTLPGAQELQRALCERVRDLAQAGAPVPVSVIALGEPAVMSADTVTLLVHGSLRQAQMVAPGAQGQLLAFTIRPFRASTENSVLFGAAPQVVLLRSPDLEGPSVDAAIVAALSELLPWRAAQARARPLAQ